MDFVIVLLIIVGIVAFAIWINIESKKLAEKRAKKYKSQTASRRKMIREMSNQNTGWKHMALVLDRAGYKSKEGEELTASDVASEHADILGHVDV